MLDQFGDLCPLQENPGFSEGLSLPALSPVELKCFMEKLVFDEDNSNFEWGTEEELNAFNVFELGTYCTVKSHESNL